MSPGGEPVGRRGSWLTLYLALTWRWRREGYASSIFPVGAFVAIAVMVSLLAALVDNAGVTDAAALAEYARRLGSTTDDSRLGMCLLVAPGIAAIMLSFGGASTARTLVGTEVGRGSVEALIAAGYRPRALATAVLAFSCTIVAGLWAAIELVVGCWLAAAAALHGADLDLSPAYLGLVIMIPLLIGCAGTSVAVTLSLLWPQLAQQGGLGLGSNGTLAGAVAILPGVATLIFPLFINASTTTVSALLAACSIGVVVLLNITTTLVAAGFRPADVLET